MLGDVLPATPPSSPSSSAAAELGAVELEYLRRYLSGALRAGASAAHGPGAAGRRSVRAALEHHRPTACRMRHPRMRRSILPGRNVLLLSKALLWCHLNEVASLALGSLGSNPFPDATPSFFRDLANVVDQSVRGRVRCCCRSRT